MQIHKFAELFPLMDEDERGVLVATIQRDGLEEPVAINCPSIDDDDPFKIPGHLRRAAQPEPVAT